MYTGDPGEGARSLLPQMNSRDGPGQLRQVKTFTMYAVSQSGKISAQPHILIMHAHAYKFRLYSYELFMLNCMKMLHA